MISTEWTELNLKEKIESIYDAILLDWGGLAQRFTIMHKRGIIITADYNKFINQIDKYIIEDEWEKYEKLKDVDKMIGKNLANFIN